MSETNKNNIFEILNKIDLTGKTDKKLELTYLSWANAWGEIKKHYPEAFYTIYTKDVDVSEVVEITDGDIKKTTTTTYKQEIPYFTDGKTGWVKVGVTIEGVEYVELLPIMDNRNNSVQASMITSVNVNRAIQRAFVKACARHGLGLYIYAGEDLPEDKRIDIKALITEAETMKFESIDEKTFNVVKDSIINQISSQSWSQDVSKELFDYIPKVLKGKRISETTHDLDWHSLLKINYILQKLNSK